MAAFLTLSGHGKERDTIGFHKSTLYFIAWILKKRKYTIDDIDLADDLEGAEVGLDINVFDLGERMYNAFYRLMLLGYDDAEKIANTTDDDKQREAIRDHLKAWKYILERIRADKRFREDS
jgi:hypothetical protein